MILSKEKSEDLLSKRMANICLKLFIRDGPAMIKALVHSQNGWELTIM